MISRWLMLTLFVIGFAPGLLHAQQEPIIHPKLTRVDMRGRRAVNIDKMYEDIEIMRRILDSKLDSLYASETRSGNIMKKEWDLPSRQLMPMFDPESNTISFVKERIVNTYDGVPFKALVGVYLKGHGVVYTATLPSLELPVKAEADSTAKLLTWTIAHPESEWDDIRRQVRNEKEEPRKPEWRKPPSLSDVLLKVLAEQGHHFSQLGENESLTIVLTVHEVSASSPPAKSGGGSAKIEPKPVPSGGGSDLRSKENDLELLGELHLKQGKYNEAIMALDKANELTKSPKRRAEVCRKLAQCYLMRQDPADLRNARATLEEAIALMEKEKETKEKPAAKPVAALPIKLIISAPKKLLDQVKAGKITFEEFRRQASVETLRFGDRR